MGEITGNATFNDSSKNNGFINQISTNKNPNVYPTAFKGNSENSGTINGDALFDDSGKNKGIVGGDAEFMKQAKNKGTVQGETKAVMRESGTSVLPEQAATATHFVKKISDFDEEGSPIWPAAGTELARLAAADEESADEMSGQISEAIQANGALYGLQSNDYKKFSKLNKTTGDSSRRKAMSKSLADLYDAQGAILEDYVVLEGPGDFQYFLMMGDPLNSGSSINLLSPYIKMSNIIKYIADGSGGWIKQYPEAGTNMFDASWFMQQFNRVINTIENENVIQTMNKAACMTMLPDLNNFPSPASMFTFFSDGNGGSYLGYPDADLLLWDVDIWSGLNDYLDGYSGTDDLKQPFIPDSAFINIPELDDAYWTEWLEDSAGGVKGMPPEASIVEYRSNGSGGAIKVWPQFDTMLWFRGRYGEHLAVDPSFTLNPQCFINIAELGEVYWPDRIVNQPVQDAVASYKSNGEGGFIREWVNYGTTLWNYALYTNMLQYNPGYQLPEAAFIQISELGDAYWTDTTPNQPPLVSIAIYKSNGEGGFYKEWSPNNTHLWGPAEYEAKLAS